MLVVAGENHDRVVKTLIPPSLRTRIRFRFVEPAGPNRLVYRLLLEGKDGSEYNICGRGEVVLFGEMVLPLQGFESAVKAAEAIATNSGYTVAVSEEHQRITCQGGSSFVRIYYANDVLADIEDLQAAIAAVVDTYAAKERVDHRSVLVGV